MGTSARIRFFDSQTEQNFVDVYQHYDGYLAGVLPALEKGIARYYRGDRQFGIRHLPPHVLGAMAEAGSNPEFDGGRLGTNYFYQVFETEGGGFGIRWQGGERSAEWPEDGEWTVVHVPAPRKPMKDYQIKRLQRDHAWLIEIGRPLTSTSFMSTLRERRLDDLDETLKTAQSTVRELIEKVNAVIVEETAFTEAYEAA